MMKKILLFLLLAVCQLALFATHQRAGEITYQHVSGLTYRFTIITYTYTPSAADRPELEIKWGDGTADTVQRTSRLNLGDDITRNTYVADHTFPSTGTFAISLEDPDRNGGIANIPNSINIPFFLETILTINPFLGANSSPQLLNPPIDNGCLNVPYYHNPGAYDPDGDSLSYSLIPCRGYEGENIPGYALPAASNHISIDPQTGILTWDSPLQQGEYNIAILIQEWRHGVLIGSVVRDMQITISACDNVPPTITAIDDTCITAGTTLTFPVIADDANSTSIALTATGGVFNLTNAPAHFASAAGPSPQTGLFRWETSCDHVRTAAYSVLFKAIDNGPQVSLSTYKTVNITVVAPKPEGLILTPLGNSILLEWQRHLCDNATGYAVYRRAGSYDFEPDNCETGLPEYTGYQLLGITNSVDDTTFTDDGTVIPLYHGNEYCYRVVAFFRDGAESYASDEACTILRNDVPRLTNVDVAETDEMEGVVNLKWLKANELDTLQYPGPRYEYRIFRASANSPFALAHTNYDFNDTTWTDASLSTSHAAYRYKVELWAEAGDSLVQAGVSDIATSIFLNITQLDRSLRLEWSEQVPWTNTNFAVYRYNESLHQFDSIGETTEHFFVDEGLQNGETYCYYVASEGGYFAPDTIAPFINRSQQACASPADITPPEVPAVVITTDCETVNLAWTFSSDSAYQDVFQYYIYYKPTHDADFTRIDSFQMDEACYPYECTYQLTDLQHITGCFAMAAIDTANNLSALSEAVCFDVDACSSYQLPNIVTPNGDGYNDLLVPFPYDNVEGVDFYLYNRWGRLIFHTTDPDINWDARKNSDGTYYYVCYVRLYSLAGIVTQELHGTVTVVR